MRSCPDRGRRRDGRRPLAGRIAIAAAAACALAAATLAPRAARSYVDGPPPAHTGGFGEPTCAACHRGGPADDGGGALEIRVPASYAPGGEHVLELRLASPGMRRAGFQLSARYAEGPRAGAQAGELLPPAEGGRGVRVAVAHDVAYAGHTAAAAPAGSGEALWRVRWRAPAGTAPIAAVAFHAAANAADYDDSELGDRVYAATAVSRPAG